MPSSGCNGRFPFAIGATDSPPRHRSGAVPAASLRGHRGRAARDGEGDGEPDAGEAAGTVADALRNGGSDGPWTWKIMEASL